LQGVLQPQTLLIAQHLLWRRLPNVDHGFAAEVSRCHQL